MASLTFTDVIDRIIQEVSGFEAYNFLKGITSLHRIQISKGLERACEVVKDKILEEASDVVEVEYFQIPASEAPHYLPIPPYWNVEDAMVEIDNERLLLQDHPTLAVAHSPPGEVEGEAVLIKNWWEPEEYKKAKGKIVVTSGNTGIVYKLAEEAGAVAVAFYKEGVPESAVPYFGLFLSYKELARASIPAVSLPNRLVRNINGKKIRIYLRSEAKPDPKIPVLCARVGERKNRGPLIVSHICHPAPGANDNASGTVSNLEALLALSRLLRRSKLRYPKETIRFLWIPEYTGTVMAIEKILSGKVDEVVNLDMVGVEPLDPEGPYHLYLSSLNAPGNVELISYLSLIKVAESLNLTNYKVEPYSGGSDHDIFVAYGSPGVMLIQWPDTRYHTDEDDVNRISKRMLKLSASIALSTVYILASGLEIPLKLNEFREWFLKSLYIFHLSKGDITAARLVGSSVARHYGVKEFAEEPRISEEIPDIKPKRRVPVIFGTRQIMDISFDKALEYSKLVKDVKNLDVYSTYLMEPVFLSDGERNIREIYKILRGVYGSKVSGKKLSSILMIFCNVGLVDC